MEPEIIQTPLWKRPFIWVLLLVAVVAMYFAVQPPLNAIATVGNTVITKDAFNKRFNQFKNFYEFQGIDISDPDFLAQSKQQTLDSMINEALIERAATKEGIVADPIQVDDAYQGAIATDVNASSTFAEYGFSVDDVKKNIGAQMVISAYVIKHTNPEALAVTDTDVENLYNTLKTGSSTPPDIIAAHDDLAGQIRLQKVDWATTQIVEKLKKETPINIYIAF